MSVMPIPGELIFSPCEMRIRIAHFLCINSLAALVDDPNRNERKMLQSLLTTA